MNDSLIIYLVAVFGSILLSMTLHEAMHAYTSHWLGDDTAKLSGRLTLNPLAHIDPFMTIALPLMLVLVGAPPFGAAKPVPFNPHNLRYGDYGSAIVGAAGPLTNLLLATIAGFFMRYFMAGEIEYFILQIFALVNVSFFVFNMIPFPPLDGSRVLYAFSPDSVRDFIVRVESMGFAALMFFMLIFYAVLSDPFVRITRHLMTIITGV